ncbi:MAG: 2-oxoisovalerate dehydrogenase [Verrucomicrobiota bacterium]
MKELIFEITEDDVTGGFVARALGCSIVTQGETWERLCANVRGAVLHHFEADEAPAVIRLHRVMEQLLVLA